MTGNYESSIIAARMFMKNQQNINSRKTEIVGFEGQFLDEGAVAYKVAKVASQMNINDGLTFLKVSNVQTAKRNCMGIDTEKSTLVPSVKPSASPLDQTQQSHL